MRLFLIYNILACFAFGYSAKAQLRLTPSFSIGKSAFFFFDSEPITFGRKCEKSFTPTQKCQLLYDYRVGLAFGSGKYGIFFLNTKYQKFEILMAITEGDLWIRKVEFSEFGMSISLKKNRFLEANLLPGFCSQKGEAVYVLGSSSTPDLSIDIVNYDSKGLSCRLETKFRPCRWVFVAANLGFQVYPKKQQSYYLSINRPRVQFISGLAIGAEIPLRLKNSFQKRKVNPDRG